MPRSVMFSGTGSKVLDIVGSQRDLDLLTAYVFEKVFGRKYGDDGLDPINMEGGDHPVNFERSFTNSKVYYKLLLNYKL